MDKKITKGPRVRLHDTATQRARTWQELTDCERDELLSPSQRRALGLSILLWSHQYVRESVAATMLGLSTAQFRQLSREHAHEIEKLEKKGQRHFLTRDVLLMKADLLLSRGTGD
ncbi:hypothetical protein [Mesorhizobium amorphae]|uniref:Uncharacterized protein n=1 Tax=Mesorhizobium amorphae CCNWGS0123 TaxID=1082933 RepID=G6YBN9_9HYPH|nr:hypothetical protein [Mesorhizobium amorphae]ANT49748.1 hypothetical protein A6B35_07245 [Mesorhizobium amorphae CCNWGS0123]EHH10880.1 hypothetical protein MEA186_16827 [Mesorhizobium amorphae CCNWGS0123]GLR40127.1 hypothetical protein GCM10007880_06430 [Mesorhizobium amorphae]